MDEACSPRFRSPCGVEIFLEEERQLVRIRHGNDLHVAALVVGLHTMVLEPIAQSDVLRVAELRRGHALAVKVFRLVDAGIVADNERGSAAGRSGHHAKSFAIGAHVAIDRGIGADVGHVDRAGKQGLDRCGTGIETSPLNLDLRSHGFIEPAIGFADHRLGVCDVGESADADGVDRSLSKKRQGRCKKRKRLARNVYSRLTPDDHGEDAGRIFLLIFLTPGILADAWAAVRDQVGQSGVVEDASRRIANIEEDLVKGAVGKIAVNQFAELLGIAEGRERTVNQSHDFAEVNFAGSRRSW